MRATPTRRSTKLRKRLDGAGRRRAGSLALWKPNVERDAQRRVNIRVTDEIVTALNEGRIVVAFEPVVEAHSRNAAFYAWCGWSRKTARRCWRRISFRSPNGSA